MKTFLLNLIKGLLPDNKELVDYPFIFVKRSYGSVSGIKERHTLESAIFSTRQEAWDWIENEISKKEQSEWVLYKLEVGGKMGSYKK